MPVMLKHALLSVLFTISFTIISAESANDQTYTSDSEFENDILQYSNSFRKEHNATALAWNTTLVDFAQAAVSACVFQHSGGPYGENLATGYGNATTCVVAWANESTKYNYKKPGFSETTGHFTQLVWKNSTQVGCARKNCTGVIVANAASGWFVACEYYPPGNYLNQFQANVQAAVTSAAKLRVACSAGWALAVVAFWAVYLRC